MLKETSKEGIFTTCSLINTDSDCHLIKTSRHFEENEILVKGVEVVKKGRRKNIQQSTDKHKHE